MYTSTLAVLVMVSQAQVPTSSEYAQMGRRLWAAFSCSAYAGFAQEAADQERLFMYGLSQGRTYIEALRANRIEREDIRTTVPLAVNLRMMGPNADFILGMIYADAEEDAAKEAWDRRDPRWVDRPVPNDDLRRMRARNAYTRGNCDAIGPPRERR